MGIPCLGYCGDFVIIAPEDRIALALESFLLFNSLVELLMKDKKSEAGSALDYLGLFATMPDGSRNSCLKLAITMTRRDKLVKLLSQLTTKRSFPNSELDSLLGKLAFAQTSVMS